MNNEQEHKLEQRIRFVAKHYEEGPARQHIDFDGW